MTDLAWIAKYRTITDAFMDYGWFVAPFMIGAEFQAVEKMADELSSNPPTTDADRKDVEDRIYKVLCEPVFNTGYRARSTWYGSQLNHLKEFNHLYESAMFSYYKREYAQSALCLLTALEGVLLSYYGYNINSGLKKPNIPDLIAKIRQTQSGFPPGSPMDLRHNLFRDTLVKFLDDWIYKNTKDSDFSLSVLNRHYVLHGMDAGNFYRPQDLHRLILAFDLLIEFFCFPQRIFLVFLPNPGENEFLDKRRGYYQTLASGALAVDQCWAMERELLKEHSRYVEPAHDPNFIESVATHLKLMTDLMNLAKRARGTGGEGE